MKSRLGFVGNSSSQSYLIHKGAYQSVLKLAIEMVKQRTDWWEDEEKGEAVNNELIKVLRSSPHDPNMPVFINTMERDTYIALEGDQYVVHTTWHHSWDLRGEMVGEKELPPTLYDRQYWYPEYNLVATPIDYDEDHNEDQKAFCENHYVENVRLETGEIICPQCEWLKNRPKEVKIDEKMAIFRKAFDALDPDCFLKIVDGKAGEEMWKELLERLEDD